MEALPSHNSEFCRMFEAHRVPIWSYCSRRLPGEETQDAVADVFLHAWRRFDRAPAEADQLLWLYGIARNIVRNVRRAGVRRRRLHVRARALAGSDFEDPAEQVIRRAEDRRLLEAVDRLDPLARELLRLRTWEELTLAEIATVTGMSTRAVESRLARARKQLASILRPHPHLGARRVADGVLEEGRHS